LWISLCESLDEKEVVDSVEFVFWFLKHCRCWVKLTVI